MARVIETKIREFNSEKSGGRRVTFTIVVDGEEVNYPDVLLPNEVDSKAVALRYEEKTLQKLAFREREKAFAWAEQGLNPADYPFKYNNKVDVLTEMYDKTLPEEIRISTKLSKLQNAKNRLMTFLGLNN